MKRKLRVSFFYFDTVSPCRGLDMLIHGASCCLHYMDGGDMT